jgi:potassium-transporting ATPase ATP-binding subunit
MSKQAKAADMSGLYPAAIRASITKLDPRALWRNPVMFVTAVVAAMTTVLGLRDFVTGVAGAGTSLHIAAWLWLCVIFANFAEALAEGRGKARADTLRATKSETKVRVLADASDDPAKGTETLSTALRAGQFVHVAAGEIIPADGEAVRGVASVNESAITGESAPVIREAGGDRSSVTGGTTVVSDWLVIRVTAEPGKSFLDRMIALVEGAERQRHQTRSR